MNLINTTDNYGQTRKKQGQNRKLYTAKTVAQDVGVSSENDFRSRITFHEANSEVHTPTNVLAQYSTLT